jgi:hypothetical protein
MQGALGASEKGAGSRDGDGLADGRLEPVGWREFRNPFLIHRLILKGCKLAVHGRRVAL